MSDPTPPLPPTGPDPAQIAANQERTMAMLCHLLAFAGLLIPFGNVLGPLIIWLIKKDTMPLVDREGRESLNFNLSFTIYTIAAILSLFIVIGIVLLPIVFVVWLIFVIIASIKTSNGETYRYPLTIRFLT
jgi:uncharacterized Tic20 family protein